MSIGKKKIANDSYTYIAYKILGIFKKGIYEAQYL